MQVDLIIISFESYDDPILSNLKRAHFIFLLPSILESVYCIAIDPRSPEQSLTGGGDNRAFLWSNVTGEKIHELEGHNDSVSSVRFSPNGMLMLTAGMDGIIHVYQTNRAKPYCSFEGPTDINVNSHVYYDGRSHISTNHICSLIIQWTEKRPIFLSDFSLFDPLVDFMAS